MKICKSFSECYPNSSREYLPVYCGLRGFRCRDYEAEEVPVESIILKPRQIVNVTYQINARSTPAFKELEEKITLINARVTKLFEKKAIKFTIRP